MALTGREKRERRIARGRADPWLIPHGTTSGYSHWDCRCGPCTAASKRKWAAGKAVWNETRRLKRHARQR